MGKPVIVFVAIVLVTAWVVGLQTPVSAGEETQRMFVGTAKCKTCHKTEAQGQQHPIWLKSAHAKAFETLGSDEAKAVAKEKGIEDPQKAGECLKCHVTGHGVDAKFLGTKYAATDGVGFESCHGAGGDYYKKATMEGVISGDIEAASVGLVMPDEKTCVGCHNEESPSYKAFDFEKMYAKIKHTIPEERKAKYKTAAK
ncbi:MAG: cytochrome c family protein [Candidatus Krumholzibacteria bacterium]|nr:cytochrome c family protein [Candidatus Krumholzibacteria bacterium]